MRKKNLIFLCLAIIAALIVFAIAFIIVNSGKDELYTEYYNDALLSFAEGDYNKSASQLRKAAEIDKKPDCMLLLGECYGRMGNYEKALAILREIKIKDKAISDKILEYENKKSAVDTQGMLVVAGKTCRVTDTDFVANDSGLSSENLSELSSLFALSNVSLKNNSITGLSFLSGLNGITSLNLSGNSINDISVISTLSSLRTLYLDENPISDFSPLYSLSGLTFLSIKDVPISQAQLSALSSALPSCTIHSEKTEQGSTVTEISVGGLQFSADVTVLDLSYRDISDISALSSCKKLQYLNLSHNYIEDLTPLMDIPSLKNVDISYNRISDLRPLMGLYTLEYINAEQNYISNIAALYTLSSLDELYLSNNSITDVSPLTKLRNLRYLGLANNTLNDDSLADLSWIPSLRQLDITDNSGVSGKAIRELKYELVDCTVSHSEIEETVFFGGLEYSANITSIDFSQRGLEDISFVAEFNSLESVNLAFNRIQNIYVFGTMEDRITYLNLANNEISDISPLAGRFSLRVLDLSNNSIRSISPLLGLTNLETLYLNGNELSEQDMTELTAALPNCSIYY